MRQKAQNPRREQPNKKWISPGRSRITSSPCRPIRVFIADGHEVVRAGVRALLEEERDVEVIGEADSADQTLSKSQQTKPDVVLLGCGLLGGWEADLCNRLFAAVPSVRIITTMWNYEGDDAAFLSVTECGAQGYVCKNIGGTELVRAIRTVAKGGSYLNPEGTNKAFRLLRQQQDAGCSRSRLDGLSPQERRVIALIAEGNTNKEIASKLVLSDKTVKNYIASMFAKLDIDRRTQAAVLYFQAQRDSLCPTVPILR
jgi:two-component system, NarL family, response regulator DevR